jgi:16S rRNA (adenine1518-N6/adenine1519-N6)-dimethyltransferase
MQEFLKNIAHHGKKLANKNLGQNFLKSEVFINQIVKSAEINPHVHVVEIGSGLGSLTYAILQKTANYTAIEKDATLVEMLAEQFPQGKFIHGDALKFDFRKIITQNTMIISNLPYNIGTKLIVKLGIEVLSQINGMVIMLQKDVIQKITSKFGSENYHHLGIFFQNFCEIQHVCDVPSSAFSPAPNVVSSVVKIAPQKHNIPLQEFWSFLQEAFCFPRKMIGGISPQYTGKHKTKRPRELTHQEWLEVFLEYSIQTPC